MQEAPETYYEHPRPEVAELVPETARRVVDVGCASGALGGLLKATRPGIEVRGIEPVAAQADTARRVLDDVVTAGAEVPYPAHWPSPDCIIFADVLEHMVDPWSVLERYHGILQPRGYLVASLPNVTHWSVIRGLKAHRWDYVDEGILDRTHLRFFTRDTAIEMFEGAGFAVRIVRRRVDTSRGAGRYFQRQLESEQGRIRKYHGVLARLADSATTQFLIGADRI